MSDTVAVHRVLRVHEVQSYVLTSLFLFVLEVSSGKSMNCSAVSCSAQSHRYTFVFM